MRGSGIVFGAVCALIGVFACKKAYDKGRKEGLEEGERMTQLVINVQKAVKENEPK